MPFKKAASSKKINKPTRSKATARSGALPPYGDPIRDAIARGNIREMKTVATSARKYLSDVSAALARLESAIKKGSPAK